MRVRSFVRLFASAFSNGTGDEMHLTNTPPLMACAPLTTAIENSWIGEELRQIRNTHAAFHLPGGTLSGMVHTAFSCMISKGKEPWTLSNTCPDSARTKPAAQCAQIAYPKPDGVLSFDLLTNLQRSGTSHDHDQPSHLRVKEELADVPSSKRYCGFALFAT